MTATRSGGGSVAMTRGGRLLTEGHDMHDLCELSGYSHGDGLLVCSRAEGHIGHHYDAEKNRNF